MTSEHAFLDSIWENLDDDTTKLIFADWLEDQDDWRNVLLRCQVERNQHGFWTRTFEDLQSRIRTQMRTHGQTWLDPLSRYHLRYSDGTGLLWLQMRAQDFLALAEPRTNEGVHRWITEVTLRGEYLTDLVAALERGPQVRLFLNFTQTRNSDLCQRLADAHGLERVRSLDLTYAILNPAQFRRLVESPRFAALQYLFLGYAQGISGVLSTLFAARHLTNLRGLDLAHCHLNDSHLIDLAHSPVVEGLTALYLESNHFGEPGLDALIQSPRFANLRVLNLQQCRFQTNPALVEMIRQRFPFVSL